MVAFSQRISGKVARLETQSQNTQRGIFNQASTLRELPQPKQDFSQESLTKCKQALKEALATIHSRDSKIQYNDREGAARIVDYINTSLSSNLVTVQTIEALHQQTQHIWKDPNQSPLANLLSEKKELSVVETNRARNRFS
jgi:hypothetical protein